MKFTLTLLSFCALSFSAFANDDNPGWGSAASRDPQAASAYLQSLSLRSGPAIEESEENPITAQEASRSLGMAVTPLQSARSVSVKSVTPGGNEVDLVTPEILSLAAGLKNDPIKIFQYVRNHIKYECYYGSKKGAHLTLLEGSGNDFDQAALLVALLRAAGQTASYEYGPCTFSYNQMVGWWGISGTPFSHWTDAQFLAEYNLPSNSTAAYTARMRKWLTVYEAARIAGYHYVEPYTSGSSEYSGFPCVP